MASGFWNFLKGIGLTPNASDQNSVKGDSNVLSSDGKIYSHNGTSSSAQVTEKHASQGAARLENKDLDASNNNIVDNSDTSKKLGVSLSGATTSTKTTIVASQTTNRSVTLPDATDTLVGKATTDTLTNKTIAAGSNTISGLTNSNLSGSAAVSNANLAAMAATTIKGNTTGGSATPTDLSVAQVQAMVIPLTTKGDLLTFSTVNDRLPLGTDGFVLTADSAQALGVKWAAASAGQAGIQFKDEGSNLGTSGTVTSIDFVGAGVTATRSSNAVTVTIPGSAGAPSFANSQAFTASGISSFTVPGGVYEVGVVVVGGGGGGGVGDGSTQTAGGGGGGGSVVFTPSYKVVPGQIIQLFVGDGGTGDGSVGTGGGTESIFGSLVANGGSGGNNYNSGNASRTGNGGGKTDNTGGQPRYGQNNPIVALDYGSSNGYFFGGTQTGTTGSLQLAGGGAGAQANGGNAVLATHAGNGGAGFAISYSGSSVTYGGGGGGGSYGGGKAGGTGGAGGGGAGGSNANGTNGTANTGGGGGGAGVTTTGGTGGSGFVGVYWN